MALPYELLIGLRYTRAKKHNHFISFISLISMFGIALGVAALIVVLSVMNGFQTELRGRILAVVSHVEITGANGEMAGWEGVATQAAGQPHVTGAAPFVQAQGMLAYGQAVRGALVRGILPDQEGKVADFGAHMKRGQLNALTPDSFNIILGAELARALGVSVGERVTLIAPQGVVTPAGVVPRLKTFTVVGLFEVGMFEYDSGLALIHLSDAQRLYRMDDRVSGVRLKLDDLFLAPRVARALASTLDTDAFISDWTQSHANFFRAVQIEKNMMFIILSLIIAVAAFNIVSTLVMAVTDKQADIAILRTLGASPMSIMAVFIVQGALIGFIGLGLGVAGGVALALNVDVVVPFIERLLGTQFLAKEVYYISNLPSELQWRDVTTITGVAFVLALVATLYPSWRAARVNPAAALRYE
ncbi:Lipoprotein-releasing system transmembrane protein LolC [Candidatus Accumulibacter aalborgensis]|uniref:Lipoprotein-releasing system transmembrane protein LolC n=1 Tax=Candidatus Accumulibacter aalborgensis TaxID=1860102 RepID=A0A1A8XYF0_9PROT|nr:lipoprotein-releasing ABC transporter permease subunit [Candidatus Accumulibacter aalborgensis]SBT09078.1 Lipoprotein-releasing system transmembrane protein LolC [Candidatus Accumulibacter aalborgensis]